MTEQPEGEDTWTAADLAQAWPIEQAARALCRKRFAEMTSNNPLPERALADAVEKFWPEYVEDAALAVEQILAAGGVASPESCEGLRLMVEGARRALPLWRKLARAEGGDHG